MVNNEVWGKGVEDFSKCHFQNIKTYFKTIRNNPKLGKSYFRKQKSVETNGAMLLKKKRALIDKYEEGDMTKEYKNCKIHFQATKKTEDYPSPF